MSFVIHYLTKNRTPSRITGAGAFEGKKIPGALTKPDAPFLFKKGLAHFVALVLRPRPAFARLTDGLICHYQATDAR